VLCYPCIVFPFAAPPQKTSYPEQGLDQFIQMARTNYNLPEHFDLSKSVFAKDGVIWYSFAGVMDRTLMGKPDYTPEEIGSYSTDKRVTPQTPPAFVWTTRTDETVPPTDSIAFVSAMMAQGCGVEFHMFAEGVHGLSLANAQTAGSPNMVSQRVSEWLPLALSWLTGVFEK
jgi:acetyl esterase/lipase